MTRNDNQVAGTTILIVDDHNSMRTSLREWLSAVFPEYHFLEAENAEDALELVLTQKPHLVLMDIKLPGMNGIEAVRKIKAGSNNIKVLMLTLYDSPEFRKDAEAAGASGYILKEKMGVDLIPTISKLMSVNTKQKKPYGSAFDL